MNRIILMLLFFVVGTSLMACSNMKDKNLENPVRWDFDHHVQFKKTRLAENYYQLEIIPNNKVRFSRLAVLLLRKSYSLCGHYHYKMEMIQGIEGFDDKQAMPNYIFPSLIAKVECNLQLLRQQLNLQ